MAFYEDDISNMLDTDEFAKDAIFSRTGSTIQVIFDNEYQTIVEGNIESSGPGCFAKETDVPGIVQNDTLIIGGVTYYVTSCQPDATGGITIILSKN